MTWVRRLWGRLHEPRVLTAVCGLCWVAVSGVGFAALMVHPPGIESEWGATLTVVWACLLLVGGLISLAGCLPGWWWVERIGMLLSLTGIAMLGSVIIIGQPTGATVWPVELALTTVAATVIAVRWTLISGPSLDPSRTLGGVHVSR